MSAVKLLRPFIVEQFVWPGNRRFANMIMVSIHNSLFAFSPKSKESKEIQRGSH